MLHTAITWNFPAIMRIYSSLLWLRIRSQLSMAKHHPAVAMQWWKGLGCPVSSFGGWKNQYLEGFSPSQSRGTEMSRRGRSSTSLCPSQAPAISCPAPWGHARAPWGFSCLLWGILSHLWPHGCQCLINCGNIPWQAPTIHLVNDQEKTEKIRY